MLDNPCKCCTLPLNSNSFFWLSLVNIHTVFCMMHLLIFCISQGEDIFWLIDCIYWVFCFKGGVTYFSCFQLISYMQLLGRAIIVFIDSFDWLGEMLILHILFDDTKRGRSVTWIWMLFFNWYHLYFEHHEYYCVGLTKWQGVKSLLKLFVIDD